MDYGVTLTVGDVETALANFFAIAAVTAILAASIGLRFVPRIVGSLKSLVGR